MTFETSQKILLLIEASRLNEFKNDLFDAALRYAGIRANYYRKPQAERNNMAAERTAAHNALIAACNILSREMGQAGEDNSWRALMGDDRREIGDFACYVHAIFGLRAR